MQTAVIFIDAGYLFSAGSDLLVGRVAARKNIRLVEPEGFLANLMTATTGLWDGEPLRLLRTYWYDGAVDGIPSPSQIAVGDLPRVKLRLGRMSAGGQKGVDGLIILDLITIARNRAADVAIILSGDEDLRETALHAQSFGVTVVVAGFPSTSRQRQSTLLLREADHVVKLSTTDVSDHLVIPRSPASTPEAAAPEESVTKDVQLVQPTPPEEEVDQSIDDLCRGVVLDPRFGGARGVLDSSSHEPRLTKQADKVLIARLAELTGTFPVDSAVVRRARERCIRMAGQAETP